MRRLLSLLALQLADQLRCEKHPLRLVAVAVSAPHPTEGGQDVKTCETCRFLEPDNRPDYAGCGTCRRFPPIVVETVAFDGSGGNLFSQHRPWMYKGEWCGEYQEQNND